ncbi:MAG: DnaD domain protein [Clostridia bacterium]|nr:DnaD domain protein [Clostridia bacterium]
MSYSINPCVWGNMFGLPADISDKYLKMANEAQIKSIVWIFRNVNTPIDANTISKSIGKPVSAVEEALRYWASVGVLNSEIAPAPAVQPAAAEKPQKVLPVIPETKPSYEQIKIRCKEDPQLEQLFNEVQQILGRTLGYDGEYSLLMMHDDYGLPSEVILMLADYCVNNGKASYAYMRKMAKSWGEKEIDSIEKADAVISNLNSVQSLWNQFARLTGIQTPKPTSVQSQYLLTWANEYKFSMEMIYCAYEIMADNCAKISFKYMDAILKDWYQKGFRTPEEIEEEKKKSPPAVKKNPKALQGTSYDMDEFKRRADKLPVYNKGE